MSLTVRLKGGSGGWGGWEIRCETHREHGQFERNPHDGRPDLRVVSPSIAGPARHGDGRAVQPFQPRQTLAILFQPV